MAKHLKHSFFITLGAVFIVAAAGLFRPLWQPFEQKIYDLKYQLAVSDRRQDRVVIVDIDSASLHELGRYQNWPRVYFAEVIAYLARSRAVGVDIFFAEPDTLPLVARAYYQKPDFDTLLRQAIRTNGRVILVSAFDAPNIFAADAQSGIGEIIADPDGVVRSGYVQIQGAKTLAAAVAGATAAPPGRFLIDYSGAGSFRRIPFSDVYFKRVPAEFFSGKTVLIGGTAPGLFDYHTVPFSRRFPGILIQANLVYGLLNGLAIRRLPDIYLLVLTLVTVMTAVFLTATRRTPVYCAAYGVIFCLLFIASFALFAQKIEMGVVRTVYALGLGIVAALINRYRFEEKEKKKIRGIFARYYSKELLDRVVDKPPRLGGEKVECTVLFADIRGFTSYAEKSSPDAVAAKLNRFLTEMVMIVFKYQGRIDKFIGDCVMAVFGSPVAVKNSAFNACLAAREMVRRASDLDFKIGIGINTGEVISGNFGSPLRMEYTVIGDTVNLAARLEGMTKQFAVSIIATAATRQMALKNPMVELKFRDLGATPVRGKEEEINIFELQ